MSQVFSFWAVIPRQGQPRRKHAYGHRMGSSTATSGHFEVHGRIGQTRESKQQVDSSTATTQKLQALGPASPIAPVEARWDPSVPHQDLRGAGGVVLSAGQHTMRAHHVADSQIQQMVCDYMNGTITLMHLLDRLGTLYLTSWVDVIVTPRMLSIWGQWMVAVGRAMNAAVSGLRRLTPTRQAAIATDLARHLSSSLANQRIGHDRTDQQLARAIAPRLHRGLGDLLYFFLRWHNNVPLNTRTLSVETTLVQRAWNAHFVAHPLNFPPGSGLIPIGNVFAGHLNPAGLGNVILISEQDPPPAIMGGAAPVRATVPTPQDYPTAMPLAGANGYYIVRGWRTAKDILAACFILYLLAMMGVVMFSYMTDSDR